MDCSPEIIHDFEEREPISSESGEVNKDLDDTSNDVDDTSNDVDDTTNDGPIIFEILRQLRDETTELPTIRHLNNYLKELRRNLEGQLGTKICLQDFETIYNENNTVPEDLDQMFVPAFFY